MNYVFDELKKGKKVIEAARVLEKQVEQLKLAAAADLRASAAIRQPSANRQSPAAIQPSTSRAAQQCPGGSAHGDYFFDRRGSGRDEPASRTIIRDVDRQAFGAFWDGMTDEQERKEALEIYHKYLMHLLGSVKKLRALGINPGRVQDGADKNLYVSHTKHTYIHTYKLFKF